MDVVAGWLAGQIVSGGGFILIGDLIVGVIGAFIGDWRAPRLGIQPRRRRLPLIIDATIAAIVLLLIIRLVSGNRRRLLGKPLRSPLVRVCSALRFLNGQLSCESRCRRWRTGFNPELRTQMANSDNVEIAAEISAAQVFQ
jgi:uncharacterized membrane protein YeaQ/YmgE (transglycosylase-associated protein family)